MCAVYLEARTPCLVFFILSFKLKKIYLNRERKRGKRGGFLILDESAADAELRLGLR